MTITARVEPSEPNRDSAAALAQGQLLSINAPAQAAHLHAKVFDGYVELLRGQPGARDRHLIAVPAPGLSNPAGGAVEPQHFAYIVQWYLFALLALAAPFAMVRTDRKEREADAGPRGRPVDRRAAPLGQTRRPVRTGGAAMTVRQRRADRR